MKKKKYIGFARAIKELRISQGLTQKEFAEKVGREQSGISRFEGGVIPTSIPVIYEIAEALGKIPVLSFKDKYEIIEEVIGKDDGGKGARFYRVVTTEDTQETLYQADTREKCQEFIEGIIEGDKK